MTLKQQWVRYAASAIAVLVIGTSLAGCTGTNGAKGNEEAVKTNGSNNSASAEQPNAENDAGADSEASAVQFLNEFEEKLETVTEASELVAFIDSRIAEATTSAGDEIVRGMFEFYDRDIANVEQSLGTNEAQSMLLMNQIPATENEAADIADPAVRELVTTALQGGYKLMMSEGYVYPQVDYAAWLRHAASLSPEMVDYIELKALETERPSVSDGGLLISWDELASRILLAEQYTRNYPHAEEAEESQTLTERYLAVYLQGVDNTPTHDYVTLKLLDEVRASYEKLIAEHPDSAAAVVTGEFLALIDARGGSMFDEKGKGEMMPSEITSFWEGLRLRVDELLHD